MKIGGILRILVFLIATSCSAYTWTTMYENNPCFHIEDSDFSIECYKWRQIYPKEYNRFHDMVKKTEPDSIWKKLPTPVNIYLYKSIPKAKIIK